MSDTETLLIVVLNGAIVGGLIGGVVAGAYGQRVRTLKRQVRNLQREIAGEDQTPWRSLRYADYRVSDVPFWDHENWVFDPRPKVVKP